MMTPKFKAYFTTDGYDVNVGEGNMRWRGSRSFTIPWKVARVENEKGDYVLTKPFEISFTDSEGNETNITIPAGGNSVTTGMKGFCASGFCDDNGFVTQARVDIKLYSKKATVFFYYNLEGITDGDANERFDLPRAFANNLVFEGYTTVEGRSAIIGDMGGCEWFGGNAQGLSGSSSCACFTASTSPIPGRSPMILTLMRTSWLRCASRISRIWDSMISRHLPLSERYS